MGSAVAVFASAFGVAAMAGLAAWLRSDRELTRKSVCAATLNSGVLGLGVSLLWYNQFRENIYYLVGLCMLAGLGGMAMVEAIVAAVQRVITPGVK